LLPFWGIKFGATTDFKGKTVLKVDLEIVQQHADNTHFDL
jgi:hypothetical protein